MDGFDEADEGPGSEASAKRKRRSEAAAAARAAPQLSKHSDWSKHEHKLPEDALLKVGARTVASLLYHDPAIS